MNRAARHHDLGKLIGSNNNNNNNFNDNELNSLQADQQQSHQQALNVNAQVIHSQDEQSPLLKQTPILGQKITQQSPSDVDGPNGAVLAKDDGKYTLTLFSLITLSPPHWPPSPPKKTKKDEETENSIYFSFHCQHDEEHIVDVVKWQIRDDAAFVNYEH